MMLGQLAKLSEKNKVRYLYFTFYIKLHFRQISDHYSTWKNIQSRASGWRLNHPNDSDILHNHIKVLEKILWKTFS